MVLRQSRREFLSAAAKAAAAVTAGTVFPPCIQRALAVPANRRTGSLQDVEYVVILTQENRSFDHYFGSFPGVRGFADPFPIPVADAVNIRGKSVWVQPNALGTLTQPVLAPFRLNTEQHFEYTRVEGTPHSWTDAQAAWDQGKLNRWTIAKRNHSLGYFTEADIPFQWALANAFTICDAYHCALQAGTNPNRLFLWTGTNDPRALGNGPATYNDYDWFNADPGNHGGYAWITYAERLEQAGVSWQVYEDMEDNFTDNPLAGFRAFRDAWFQRPGFSQALRERGVSTRALGAFADDVLADRLPQVSWIVAPAESSEHPGPSSPAQGADYTARLLDALTANPDVWSKTVLIVNFDENDGFFDHIPPPAPPSYVTWNADPTQAELAGASTVDTTGEYHEVLVSYHSGSSERALLHRPYGLGPRVPLYAVSPWSKGGWVDSRVYDHTSVIRFLEARFGVREPNISAWRRAVCGDLTAAFDFSMQDDGNTELPATLDRAERARALPGHATPPVPAALTLPTQERGIRRSRALPYSLGVVSRIDTIETVALEFDNSGTAAAVIHVYDRLHLDATPRRYTVEPGKQLRDRWNTLRSGAYDLWVIGPNGFHRHFAGIANGVGAPEVHVDHRPKTNTLSMTLINKTNESAMFTVAMNRYSNEPSADYDVPGQSSTVVTAPLVSGGWYDISVTASSEASFGRRFAGRWETGADSIADPAMHGEALADQFRFTSD